MLPVLTGATLGLNVGSTILGISSSNKAKKQAKENARRAKEASAYNAMTADGKARQALENARYDADFADLQTFYDVFIMEYEKEMLENKAVYEANVSKQIDYDGGINAIRKRKQNVLELADAEAEALASGALLSGSVLEALTESAMNLEIDALEINRMSKIESNDRLYRSRVKEAEAGLLGAKTAMRKTYGDMQSSEILRQGRLLSLDYKREAERLRKYGDIDSGNFQVQADQYGRQAIAQGIQGLSSAAEIYSDYKTQTKPIA